MEIINKITLDMALAGMPPHVDAVQGDTLTRKIEITLVNKGQVFDPSDGFVSVSVAFKKPDGTAGWYDTMPDGSSAATVISDGVYQVSLAPEMFTVPGSVYALFRFDLDGQTISTFPFFVRVSENPSFNSSKSENYYNVQTWDAVNASFDEIFDRLAELEQGGVGAGIDDENISTETTWSSQNIVDKLCPSFNEKGAVVECTPIVGYPLTVITHVPAEATGEQVTLYHTGKNLLKSSAKTSTSAGVTFTVNEDKSITIQTGAEGATGIATLVYLGAYPGATAGEPAAESGFIPGETYTVSAGALYAGVAMVFYGYRADGSVAASRELYNSASYSFTAPEGLNRLYGYIKVSQGTVLTNPATIYPMIVKGSVVGDYEPYWGETKTVTIPDSALEGTYNWGTGLLTEVNGHTTQLAPQPITPYNGINIFFSSVGDTEVNGKEDPYANIQRLWEIVNTLIGG